MATVIKATFNYSATAATTGEWTLTASTSIAVGDTLLLSLRYSSSASGSTSAIFDNAGNTWTLIGRGGGANPTEAWYAPVTTTTANFQIATSRSFAKSLSARAAHVIVLSGAHATQPIDLGSVATLLLSATLATAATLATSATTTVDAGMLLAVGTVNNVASASLAADIAWSAVGNILAVTGGTSVFKHYSWQRSIGAPAIYNFSASISHGGAGRNTQLIVFAVRGGAADTGSMTGTSTVVFGNAATLVGVGSLSGAATVVFGSQATLVDGAAPTGSVSGTATIAFGDAATLVGIGSMASNATVLFGSQATLAGTTATASASIAQVVAQSSGGAGSWEPHVFRQLLLQKKRKLEKAVAVVANDAADTPLETPVDKLQDRIELAPIPDTTAAMRRALQSLEAMERRLQALQAKVQKAVEDNDDEDDLLMLIA